MALFQPILGNLSGSIDGSMGEQQRRPIRTPAHRSHQPTTLRQTAVRSYLRNPVGDVARLDSAQRSGWNIYALNPGA